MSIISRIRDFLSPESAPAREPPTRLPSPDELVLLCRPEGEPEAELLRGILADNDIRSMVKNRDALSAQVGGAGSAWAYELWVLRKDLRRAKEVLELDDSGESK